MKEVIEVLVSDDGMEARLRLPSEQQGDPTRLDRLRSALAKAGVKHGLKTEILAAIEAAIADPAYFYEDLIAEGEAPTPGVPGRMITAYSPFLATGEADDFDRLDYRERHYLTLGHEHLVVARRYPAIPGKPGRNVRGEEVAAEPVREDPTQLGHGVEVDERGFVRVTRSGVMHLRPGERLDVIDLYEHKGAVGPETGNLATSGSLIVHGDIQPGFRVDADGDLVIKGNVDQASFRAGGSVEVTLAVIGSVTTLGRAGCDMSCKRAQGANLQVRGRMTFDREMFNVNLRARRLECSSPRGAVLGARILVSECIKVPTVGSRSGSPVHLEVGVDWRLQDRLRRLEAAALSRGKQRRAGQENRGRGGRRPGKTEDEIHALRLELRRRNQTLLELATIEVAGTIHAGVTLKFGTTEETLTEDESNVRFRLDPETKTIAREKLKR
ncbi:MAG: DUF342 domain-containing protein [Planctomycetes bacterium]|nr:DUF342 domain-containing protein [Planctomycetota bacterium]